MRRRCEEIARKEVAKPTLVKGNKSVPNGVRPKATKFSATSDATSCTDQLAARRFGVPKNCACSPVSSPNTTFEITGGLKFSTNPSEIATAETCPILSV